MYVARGMGGVLYLAGAVIMCWNLWMTVRAGKPAAVNTPAMQPAE
jgi:cytochrome c oxidase cbb3-type subunit 1